MKYLEMNNAIIEKLQGKENIQSVSHCMTRLRFIVKNEEGINKQEIESIPGVLQLVNSGGQMQVVIGTHVNDVYAELVEVLEIEVSGDEFVDENLDEDLTKPKASITDRFIQMISKIFMPAMGPLVAAGLIKGILAILQVSGVLVETDGAYVLLHALSDAPMYFFPIIIGFSAGRAFKTNEYVAASLGAVLVYPTLVETFMTGGSLDFFGIPVILLLYTSTVIPVIVAAWFASVLERFFKKVLPSLLQFVFVPFFVILIAGLFTIMLIGPISGAISMGLSALVMGIYNFAPPVAAFLIGSTWQLLVMFGLHWGFVPVFMSEFQEMGYSVIAPLIGVTVFAQSGAVLGVFLKSKDSAIKQIAGGSAFSALLGVTEPALYGISIRFKKVFYITMLGGGVGATISTLMGAKSFAMGVPSILTMAGYIDPAGIDLGFYGAVLGSIVAFLLSLVLTYLFGYKDESEAN